MLFLANSPPNYHLKSIWIHQGRWLILAAFHRHLCLKTTFIHFIAKISIRLINKKCAKPYGSCWVSLAHLFLVIYF